MADETITIRAEMIGNIAEEAEKNRAAMQKMTADMAGSFAGVGTAVDKLNAHLDKFNAVGHQAKQPVDKLNESMKRLHETGNQLREGIVGVGDTIKEKMTYPVQQLTWALEGAAAGMITLGVTTNMSLQSARTQLGMFGAAGSFGALYGMSGAVNMSTLTGGMLSGNLAGLSGGTSRALLGAATSAADPYGPGANALVSSAMGAFGDVRTHMGLTSASDIAAIAALDPGIYGQLGGAQGMSGMAERHLFALGGQNMINPQLLYSMFEQSGQARTGASKYNATTAGQLEMLKKDFSRMLANLETPLVGFLGREGSAVAGWARGVSHRYGQDSGTLGKEWGAGNMGGFSTTLASVLGDPKMAKGIDEVIKFGQDLDHIFTGAVIPALKTFGEVALPVFGFLADHPHLLDGLVLGFTGLMVLDKILGPLATINRLLRTFSIVAGEGGAASAATTLGRSLVGLPAKTAAADTAEGGAGGTAALGWGGAGAIFAALGLGERHNYNQNLKHGLIGSGMTGVPAISAGGFAGLLAHPGSSLLHPVGSFESLFGLGGHHATHIGHINMNITATHANPESVAKAMPKALNAQITAHKKMQERRQPKSPNHPQPSSKR